MEQQDVDRAGEDRFEVPALTPRQPGGRPASSDNPAAAAAIKTILVGASGGSASNGAIELASWLADRLRAHVEGFHVLIDPIAVLVSTGAGEGFAFYGDVVAEMVDEADANAAQAKSSFKEIATRYHLPYRDLAQIAAARDGGPSVGWREETGDPSHLVAERARFFDLIVLGRSSRVVDGPSSNTIQAVLTQSGRPVLLAPAVPAATLGQAVAIAWNGSPQAVRAFAVSLPLLVTADSILVITVGDDSDSDIPAVLDYLAWHGITAKHRQIPATSSESTGVLLLNAAQEAGADTLVMGGYGHKPWREALFGGVTRDIVEEIAPLAADALNAL